VLSLQQGRLSPKAEMFTLQMGISTALAVCCHSLVMFCDSAVVLASWFDTSPKGRQVHALKACIAIWPWFKEDPGHSVMLWQVPSAAKWKVHKLAHDIATSGWVPVGTNQQTFHKFVLASINDITMHMWHMDFLRPEDHRLSWLGLKGTTGKIFMPSIHKNSPWLWYQPTDFP
jgi:hypothetical protein